METNSNNNNDGFICKICNIIYKNRSGLWKHNKNSHMETEPPKYNQTDNHTNLDHNHNDNHNDKYIKLLKVYDGYQEEYHHMMRHVNCVPHYTVLWSRGLVWR